MFGGNIAFNQPLAWNTSRVTDMHSTFRGAAAFDQLIRTLCDALGLSVFLVTHDLDTLYAICDRVAVLSQKRVLIADTLERVADTRDAWIQDYFHGPRGRAAAYQQPTPAKE